MIVARHWLPCGQWYRRVRPRLRFDSPGGADQSMGGDEEGIVNCKRALLRSQRFLSCPHVNMLHAHMFTCMPASVKHAYINIWQVFSYTCACLRMCMTTGRKTHCRLGSTRLRRGTLEDWIPGGDPRIRMSQGPTPRTDLQDGISQQIWGHICNRFRVLIGD